MVVVGVHGRRREKRRRPVFPAHLADIVTLRVVSGPGSGRLDDARDGLEIKAKANAELGADVLHGLAGLQLAAQPRDVRA